jgi:ubiquinone/menaquinone biosynthesis C-methylase UbiE
MIGTDRSTGILETASQKSELYELLAADSMMLPIRSQVFDSFISIAVIHHFSQ